MFMPNRFCWKNFLWLTPHLFIQFRISPTAVHFFFYFLWSVRECISKAEKIICQSCSLDICITSIIFISLDDRAINFTVIQHLLFKISAAQQNHQLWIWAPSVTGTYDAQIWILIQTWVQWLGIWLYTLEI